MEKVPETSEENIEVKYEKCRGFANQVYQEYENLHRVMCSKLNGDHLNPFAKILKEHEGIALKSPDELIESVRQNLEKQMNDALHSIWHSNTLEEALISLEMVKEKFKPYEGHKWNLNAKTPRDLTRPIRMRFKENRFRYLQAQLSFQGKELEEVILENESIRRKLLDVKNQRTFLYENMEIFRKKIEVAKRKIMELQLKMLEGNYENEPSSDMEDSGTL